MLLRALVIWFLIVAVETAHGIVRRLVVEPRIGDLRARQAGVAIGSCLILLVTFVTLPWLGPMTAAQQWGVGLLWLTLMLPFEIVIGRLTGASWARIRSDYDPREGGFLAFGLLVLLAAPMLAAWARRALGL